MTFHKNTSLAYIRTSPELPRMKFIRTYSFKFIFDELNDVPSYLLWVSRRALTIDGWYHVKRWRVSELSSLDLLTLEVGLRSEYIESQGFLHYNRASAVPYLLWACTTSFPDRECLASILSTYAWVIKLELPMLKRYIDINVQPAFRFPTSKGPHFKFPLTSGSSWRNIRP